jgi:hypothetical protein
MFWRNKEKSVKLKGLEYGFISKLEVDDETHPSPKSM